MTINGKPGQLNTFVVASDVVEVDGKTVAKQRLAYVLLHKPPGVVTTARDPQGRPTVVDLVGHESRVVPVGRLDVDTTGALLLTNDGPLAHRLAHPRYGVEKVYEVETWKQPTDGVLRKLADGVNLEDGRTAPARARRLSGSRFELVLHEGRNRQVRRMVEAVGHRVKALHRSTYAGLGLGKLKPGEWRELTRAEVETISAPRAPRSPSARTSPAASGPTPRGPSQRRGRGGAAAQPDPPAAPGSAPGSARPPRRPPRRRPA